MTTLTPHFGWSLPDPGGSPNTWGDTLNQTTGKIDEQVFQNTQAALPIGAMVMFAGATAPPNWMICDGRSLDRGTYQPLFAVIGTLFGAADSTRFNIPNFAGKQPVGANGTVGLGVSDGAATFTLSTDNLPQHAHTIQDPQHYHTITDVAHGHTASQPAHNHTDPGHGHTASGSHPHTHGGPWGAPGAGSWYFSSSVNGLQQVNQSGQSYQPNDPNLTISVGAGSANLQAAQPAITVANSGTNIHNTDYGLTRITTTDVGGGVVTPAAVSTWSPYTKVNFIIRFQ